MGLNGKKHLLQTIIRAYYRKVSIFNPKEAVLDIDTTPYYSKSTISYVSGVKIRMAGRFYRRKIVPRKTVFNIQRGSLARKVVKFVEKSKYINKSKRGSFCLTVSISHFF